MSGGNRWGDVRVWLSSDAVRNVSVERRSGVPANPGWMRWAGGFVLGIAIGPWLASEGWAKEEPFIAGVAAALLCPASRCSIAL